MEIACRDPESAAIFTRVAVIASLWLCCQTGAFAAQIDDLIRDLRAADSQSQRLAILRGLEAEVRAGNLRVPHVNGITGQVMSNDTAPGPASLSLLRSMLASPIGRDETARAIGIRLARSPVAYDVAQPLFLLLVDQDGTYGLPDAVFEQLTKAFPDIADPALRARMYAFVRESPWALVNRDEFLPGVARLLESRFPAPERQEALALLAQAAADGPLPGRALSHLRRFMLDDPEAAFRITAWEILRQQDRASGNTGLPLGLLREIRDPDAERSLYNADPETRERGIALIVRDWQAHPSIEYVDSLITVVERTGSPAALNELVELRRVDGLSERQVGRLRSVGAADSAGQTLLAAIIAPPMSDGSPLGPIEVIEHSRSPESRRQAFELLLDTYPERPVPEQISDLAYRQLTTQRDVPAAAGALFALGDEPFAEQERKLLALVDRSPRPHGAIKVGLKTLHADADTEFLVREYAGSSEIAETFRASLVNDLSQETRRGKTLRLDTITVLQKLGESAKNYGTVDAVIRVFESIDRPVSWRIRIKSKRFQWSVLGSMLVVSWILAVLGGAAWLVHLIWPYEHHESPGSRALAGAVALIFMTVLFLGANAVALLLSLGHTSIPRPDEAALFYLIVLGLAFAIAAIGFGAWRKRLAA